MLCTAIVLIPILHILDRVKMVADGGGNGVHVNFWSGHGVYKSVNELGLSICTHSKRHWRQNY